MIEKGFWRGYWPLLLALATVQASQQVDIIMMGRLGGGAQAAYVLLTRIAVIDLVAMTATSAVASTFVAQAMRNGDKERVVGDVLGLSALAGLCCCALGLAYYSRAAMLLAGDREIGALVGDGVFWFALAAPFRFVANTGAFVIHVLGHGSAVARWKLVEVGAKAAGNLLFMIQFGAGFAGCFQSGLVVAILSSLWCRRALARHDIRWLSIPEYSWTARFLRFAAWEAQRNISVHLALLAGFALFAAPWLGHEAALRLEPYAAGQTLMLVVFAPLIALTRFLAFRLANAPSEALAPLVKSLSMRGAPVAAAAAFVLFLARDALGELYGQRGPWWSMLIAILAISLPIRYAANVSRAALQAKGAFAAVAGADNAAFWLCALPLVATGLYFDSPALAYQSLVLPEAACAAWLWSRLRAPGTDLDSVDIGTQAFPARRRISEFEKTGLERSRS